MQLKYYRTISLFSLFIVMLLSCICACGTYPHDAAKRPALYAENEFREFAAYANDRFLKSGLKSHPESKGYALLIGIDHNNFSGSPSLPRPVYETTGLKVKLEQCGYAVKLLTDQDATRRNILEWLNFFSSISRKPDLFFLFYSGHGFTPSGSREALSGGLVNLYFPGAGTETSLTAYRDDFHMLCYQDIPFYNDRRQQLIASAVGNYEILGILSGSRFSVKIEIVDACTANRINIALPAAPPVNYFSLERQGFFFCCMLKDTVLDGEFMPIILPGLNAEADTVTGNRDGLVTVFELINYTNWKRSNIFRMAGLTDNEIKYIIYCSEDIPLAYVDLKP